MFSSEEDALRETVQRFARETIGPKVSKMDEQGKLEPEILPALFAQGLMGMETPAALGGAEMSFVSSLIVIEELAKVDPAISVIVDIQNTLVNTILRKVGNEAQQKAYLPRLAQSNLGAFALSESGSGSDAFAMKTTAVRKGDSFVLNGTKMWISNSNEAELFLVMANADPSQGYKGITCFVVERSNPGLKIGKKENKTGIRASSTCELVLDNCVVHEKNVVGSVGKGYKIAIESLNEGRIGIGAQMLGLAQGAFDATIPYLHQRKQFGKSIAEFQGVQFDIAKMAMDIEAARVLVYNAGRLQESGKPFVTEASIAKLYASLCAERVSSKCVELMGGVGYTKEFPIEKFWRDCKIGQIYEGTNNMQLQTIARAISKKYTGQ